MKDFIVFAWHLLIAFFKLYKNGGSRQFVAENTALKHQLMVMNRSQKRSPKFTSADRFLLGLCGFWI